MEITKSKGVTSTAEQVFGGLLQDSVTEVFNGTLGPIAGQALLDAVKRYSSLELKDVLARPQLLDEALKRHLGSVARVLERSILRTLARKAAVGIVPFEGEHFDFAREVETVSGQFLKRKQTRTQTHLLE